MADAIAHRGPDDSGIWTEPSLGIALGHRRLAIIDVSADGHQPMISASGRYVVVYNGEIYNYQDLRRELEDSGRAPVWRGHSDTEVLLAACDAWGIERALAALNGMFAIALLDRAERTLFLVRDRMGEKPLYYGWQGSAFLFGSELKALRAHPQFENRMDAQALPLFVRFGYIPTPFSIYAGIKKLPPGCFLRVPLRAHAGSFQPEPYWRVPIPEERAMDPATAAEQLEHLLRDAVRIRMHADVPLGAFLSGGIDSSMIVALMQSQATRPVRTYSIGFRESGYDEAAAASAVAKTLATDHTELYVTADDALKVVPMLSDMYDEPFADSSQIPTYLLSKLTRRNVTVALSGDGGDELFGGYVRYIQARSLLRIHKLLPAWSRRGCARALTLAASRGSDRLTALLPRNVRGHLTRDRLGKLAEVIALNGYRELYGRLVSQWANPASVVAAAIATPTLLDDNAIAGRIDAAAPWMMYVDQLTYLPDDILVKVDRASMAVALEARVPFLDYRVVEFAASLPLKFKLADGMGKWLLRQVLYKHVDRRLVERPKQGFGIPVADWLRGPLRDWAEGLLCEPALSRGGLFNTQVIRDAWAQHLQGDRNFQYPLWVILMFQAWYLRAGPAL
jgi:asparagine synthase (glutamine-hydrolysing)